MWIQRGEVTYPKPQNFDGAEIGTSSTASGKYENLAWSPCLLTPKP